MLEWFIIEFFALYAGVGVVTLLAWWTIYALVLSRGWSLRAALFGRRPNPAVALDLLGGFLAAGFLIYSIISMAPMASFRLQIPAVALSILVTLVLLALLRFMIAGLLRVWFGSHRDAQGDMISFNNELFRQRNIATSVFSSVLYMILVAGLAQLDLWNMEGARIEGIYNMLGTWVMGAAVVLIHSFLYLEYGTRNHILHECFHDNNPAAATSLFGLAAGMLMLGHQLLQLFIPEAHMFNTPQLWLFLAGVLLLVLVLRGVLQVILWLAIGVNLRHELVIHDNVAWGLVDGGVIFALFLIPVALIN
jgi:hypothetical protein